MSTGGVNSYSGKSYDRFVERQDDSSLARLKQHFWTAKQAVRSKLGKKEDDHLVASDAQLDAKLAVYSALKDTCEDMLRCIEDYQDFICEVSQEENALGRFLKQQGKIDKTQAGKMMVAVGRAQSYSAQQRLALRVPLVRLYSELEVFYERAVADCQQTVDRVERARMEYRGSLLWMKKVSDELDPDTYRQLDKFRKVQTAVRRNKARFDKHKLDCLQKVDLLAASRCNLFSQLLTNYQNCVLNFWDRASSAHSTVSENYKGYQHFEFTVCKDLAEPSKRLAQLTAGTSEDIAHEAMEGDNNGGSPEAENSTNAEETRDDLLIGNINNSGEDINKLSDLLNQPIPRLAPIPWDESHSHMNIHRNGETSDKRAEADILFDQFLSSNVDTDDSFSAQWKDAFGSTSDAPLSPAMANDEPREANLLPSNLFDSLNFMHENHDSSIKSMGATGEKNVSKEKDWFGLFADLDPLKQCDHGKDGPC